MRRKQLQFVRAKGFMGICKPPGPPRTTIWLVRSVSPGNYKGLVIATLNTVGLGFVYWHNKWRSYAFEPFQKTVFSPTCSRDIADFCETRTKQHKERERKHPFRAQHDRKRVR